MSSSSWIVILLLVANVVNAHVDHRVYCTHVLASARSLFCSGYYESTGEDGQVHKFEIKPTTPLSPEDRYELVEKCCSRPCYLSELLSYC